MASSANVKDNCITIVELGHNSSPLAGQAVDRSISMTQYQTLLKDPGQVDSPLLARLGYPVIIVSKRPGQKCIPQAQMVPTGNNPQNNRMATVAASRISSGLAVGCVIGNVYAMRTDGKDLTAKEWYLLFDVLMTLMDYYGDGPGAVNDRVFADLQADLRQRMRREGLLKEAGAGSGAHCWECGVEGGEEVQLLKCGKCKVARYCSKECQRTHWRAGHKEDCTPQQSPRQAEAEKTQRLLETAVLKPEQVIKVNADAPPLPAPGHRPPNFTTLAAAMPPEDLAIFLFNKDSRNKERLCISCRTRYRLLDPLPNDQCAREQKLSGTCSYRCWCALNPPGSRYAAPEWYGQEAMNPEDHGVHLGIL